MLPMLLIPAMLVAAPAKPAKAPVVKGPSVEGWIYNQAGKPLQATVGLIPMSNRDSSLAVKSVESLGFAKKKKPGFTLSIPQPGLYLLDVRAQNHHTLQIPVLLGEEGLKDVKFTPRPEKPKGEVKPITEDAKLLRFEAAYGAFKGREDRFKAAMKNREKVDWASDVTAVGTEFKAETDADMQGFLAISYLGLGNMNAKLDKETAGLALDKLPANSPWWSVGNYSYAGFYASERNEQYAAFREALAKQSPDAEVRATAMMAQLAALSRNSDGEAMRPIYNTLTTEYKDTVAAKGVKRFDPEKMLLNGKAFPTFSFKDIEGQDVSLESFKGKLVLVDFWATWCPPCVKEMPELHAVYEKFKGQGFEILSFSLDKAVEDITPFRADATHPMPWRHVFLGRDSKDPILSAVGLTTIPRPILVGPDGNVFEAQGEKLRGASLMESVGAAMKKLGRSTEPVAAPASTLAPAPQTDVK